MSTNPPASTHKAGLSRGRMLQFALLAFAPIAIALHYLRPEAGTWVFVCCCIAIIPLAGFMGHATEALSHRAGPGLGGLLSATFGNAAELILALAALRAGHVEVVKASLTGSILSNLLLILGLSMFVGGLRRKHEQRFSPHLAETGSALMMLAVVGLFVPALFHAVRQEAALPVLRPMSVGISIILLALYAASLFFQLRTHKHLYGEESAAGEGSEAGEAGGAGEPHMSTRRALAQLLLATTGVAVVSEFLVEGLESAIHTFGFTETFVGVIVLAMVGNAAEQSTAIVMAAKDRMSLSYSIAVASSTQIALFAAPFLVLVSGLLGHPISLEFSTFETAAVGIGVVSATLVGLDGRSNWLEGAMLLGVYCILGVAFFFMP